MSLRPLGIKAQRVAHTYGVHSQVFWLAPYPCQVSRIDLSDRRPIRALLDGTLIKRGAFSAAGRRYQMCAFCVMDTTDPEITFDVNGICNHCTSARRKMALAMRKKGALEEMVDVVRRRGQGRAFDCLVGLSGGVDSSFVVARAVDWGLKPLVVHVDTGWNSEIAVGNIRRMLKALNLDLQTVVINWKSMKSLQLAFLRSGLANLDVPQDHAIFSTLMRMARSSGVGVLLTGSNWATESILPRQWGYRAMDGRHLAAVHSRFAQQELKEFPVTSLTRDVFARNLSRRVRRIDALEYINYSRSEASAELQDRFGWRSYGPKHAESTWTAYFQRILLPYRFGYDKRKAHLSSCIASGQLTREEALAELAEPLVTDRNRDQGRLHVSRKLGLSRTEMIEIEEAPLAHFSDFPNDDGIARIMHLAKNSMPRGAAARLLARH